MTVGKTGCNTTSDKNVTTWEEYMRTDCLKSISMPQVFYNRFRVKVLCNFATLEWFLCKQCIRSVQKQSIITTQSGLQHQGIQHPNRNCAEVIPATLWGATAAWCDDTDTERGEAFEYTGSCYKGHMLDLTLLTCSKTAVPSHKLVIARQVYFIWTHFRHYETPLCCPVASHFFNGLFEFHSFTNFQAAIVHLFSSADVGWCVH